MPNNTEILSIWNDVGRILSIVILAGAIGLLGYYYIRLSAIRDYKAKYDYINRFEIRFLWYSSLLVIIGAGLMVNVLKDDPDMMWFLVRIFVTAMLGLIIGVVVSNVLKFYYPFYVEKRLKRLRYTPRISPKSGKPMKLLSEEEEDVYLDEGMQAEENVFSVDYDVWIDEENNFTKIEKYAGHLHALQCPECNYQTFKVVREEILESPTTDREGELMKFYKCSYCGYKSRKVFKVAKLREKGRLGSAKTSASV